MRVNVQRSTGKPQCEDGRRDPERNDKSNDDCTGKAFKLRRKYKKNDDQRDRISEDDLTRGFFQGRRFAKQNERNVIGQNLTRELPQLIDRRAQISSGCEFQTYFD